MLPQDTLARLGGVARRAELIEAGWWDEHIEMAVTFRRIVRVRKGLYALPTVCPEGLVALKVGGRLACVSALAHHEGRCADPGEVIHVEVRSTASRLRLPADRTVVVHWTRQRHAGSRVTVSETVARAQAARCRGLA